MTTKRERDMARVVRALTRTDENGTLAFPEVDAVLLVYSQGWALRSGRRYQTNLANARALAESVIAEMRRDGR